MSQASYRIIQSKLLDGNVCVIWYTIFSVQNDMHEGVYIKHYETVHFMFTCMSVVSGCVCKKRTCVRKRRNEEYK